MRTCPTANTRSPDIQPPLPYPDRHFDLVINHSAFTHLDERLQNLWLEELRRISAPGALLLLTVEGTTSWNRCCTDHGLDNPLLRRWKKEIESRGIVFIRDDTFVGSTHPDFYHSTFHAPWYIFEHWSQFFDVVAYLPEGSDTQDLVVCVAARTQRASHPRSHLGPPGVGSVAVKSGTTRSAHFNRPCARCVCGIGFDQQRYTANSACCAPVSTNRATECRSSRPSFAPNSTRNATVATRALRLKIDREPLRRSGPGDPPP